MAELNQIKTDLIDALESMEVEADGYGEILGMLEKVKKLELEEERLYSQENLEEEKLKSQDRKALLDLAGKGLLVGGSFSLAMIAEHAKSDGVIMKVSEWFSQAGNLFRKA